MGIVPQNVTAASALVVAERLAGMTPHDSIQCHASWLQVSPGASCARGGVIINYKG